MNVICTECLNADIEAGFAHNIVDEPFWTNIAPECCDNIHSMYEVVQVS